MAPMASTQCTLPMVCGLNPMLNAAQGVQGSGCIQALGQPPVLSAVLGPAHTLYTPCAGPRSWHALYATHGLNLVPQPVHRGPVLVQPTDLLRDIIQPGWSCRAGWFGHPWYRVLPNYCTMHAVTKLCFRCKCILRTCMATKLYIAYEEWHDSGVILLLFSNECPSPSIFPKKESSWRNQGR